MKSYRHMFRFFADYDPHQGWKVPADEVRHMSKVLRFKAGQKVELCDGKGRIALMRIHHLEGSSMEATEESFNEYEPCLPYISLYVMSDISSELARSLLPPLTELGVNRVRWSVSSKRALSSSYKQRLHRVAVAAIKQSKAPFMVHLDPRISLVDDLEATKGDISCVLDPDAEISLSDFLFQERKSSQRSWSFYIGGAGGWSEEHIELLGAFPKAHLGPYVLRVPTALTSTAALVRGILGSSHQGMQGL